MLGLARLMMQVLGLTAAAAAAAQVVHGPRFCDARSVCSLCWWVTARSLRESLTMVPTTSR